MIAPRAIAPLLCTIAAGCMPAVRPAAAARPDPVVRQLISQAASRIQRCYQAPRLPRASRLIETTLAVRYAPDGSLATLPEVVVQRNVTDANRGDAERMAEAARAAVIRCAPLNLPAERYQGGWDMFQLTFSPKAVA
jgi:hypothetical protein